MCGDYDVVGKSDIDTSTEWYYQAGELVAVVRKIDVVLGCSAAHGRYMGRLAVIERTLGAPPPLPPPE